MRLRVKDLEFRTEYKGKAMDWNRWPEIVQWFRDGAGQESCQAIIWLQPKKGGWDVVNIGRRPFEESVDAQALAKLVRVAFEMLELVGPSDDFVEEGLDPTTTEKRTP